MRKSLPVVLTLVFGLFCTSQVFAQSNSNHSGAQTRPTPARDTPKNRPVVIEFKPEPGKPKEVGNTSYEGTIVLRAIFRKNGKVTDIEFVEAKPPRFFDGSLTKKAIEAAKKIRFKPAMKDGRPVSMLMQLEYNFKLN